MKKILTAEDDREINRLISEYLSSQGYETLSALNGLDAVRIVREQSDLSLLILDLMLPFQSGDMVLQKIREFSDIPVIVVSAKSETEEQFVDRIAALYRFIGHTNFNKNSRVATEQSGALSAEGLSVLLRV